MNRISKGFKFLGGISLAIYLAFFSLTVKGASAALNLCDVGNRVGVNGINNLCNITTQGVIQSVISIGLFISFIAALGFLIYGGIRWVLSGGDKEGTAKAKGIVTGALVGLAIVLGSWIMLNIILAFFGVTGGLTNLNVPILTNN